MAIDKEILMALDNNDAIENMADGIELLCHLLVNNK